MDIEDEEGENDMSDVKLLGHITQGIPITRNKKRKATPLKNPKHPKRPKHSRRPTHKKYSVKKVRTRS